MFIKRALIAAIWFGAAVYAQTKGGTDESATEPAAGTPIPVSANQDRIPASVLFANLSTSSISANVTFTSQLIQMSPMSDEKELKIVASRGLTNSTENAYRLAIHTGHAKNGDCNNTSIGAILDPDHRFGRMGCVVGGGVETCAIGDLDGQAGGFNGNPDGTVNIVKKVEYLPFNNSAGYAIINRMLMLYEGDRRIACGIITASNSTAKIPDDIPNSGVNLQSPLNTITVSMIGSALAGLVLTAIH